MTAVYATIPGTLLLALHARRLLAKALDVPPSFTRPTPTVAQPGRDCPACRCERMQHTGWGCTCGCQVGIVHISRRP